MANDRVAKLSIEIGTPLQVEVVGDENRYRSFLVGMQRDDFLIIKVPQNPDFPRSDAVELEYRIRYVYQGTVFGFPAVAMGTEGPPVDVLFLEYPAKVENFELRSHRRVSCTLPARIDSEELTLAGVFLDMSDRGGCWVSKDPKASELSSGQSVSVAVDIPGCEGETRLEGTIRRAAKVASRVNLGVEFEESSPEVEQFITNLAEFLEEPPPTDEGD
jgi:hypothetical protein